MENKRIIRVIGKGNLKLRPDVTRLVITCKGIYKEYGETLKQSAEDTAVIRDLFIQASFEYTDLKTLNFSVDTEYERYQERSVWKQRFIGYTYCHVMKIEFPSNNDRLGRILYSLSKCSVKPEFRISYTVSDPEAAKNELLRKAVFDAKDKAVILSDAAGVKLKTIQSIDYSWEEISFEVNPMNQFREIVGLNDMYEEGLGFDVDIEPDDIQASDTVSVVWEIE